jgi:hypothetical protein
MSKPNNKKPMPLEEWEQMQIFVWKDKWVGKYPRLKLLHCSLNGIRISLGLARKYVKLGMTSGVPDLCFPAKSKDMKYPGLYIELKRRGKVDNVSDNQVLFINALREEGYCVCICEGYHEAIDVIAGWLGMSEAEQWSKEIQGIGEK